MNTPVVSPLPPWFPVGGYLAKDFPLKAKNSNPIVVRQIFNEFCSQEYFNYTQIYTDGSKYASPNSCSAALYVPDFDYTDKWHLPSQSIVTAELFGILKALQFSIDFLEDFDIAIFTDSLVALSLIKGYSLAFRVLLFPIHSCLEVIHNKKMKLVIQWIPSHSGISGNEYVDSLAKEAHNILDLTSIPIPFKESTTICHRAIWDSWRVERETELKFSNLGTLREGNKMAPLETFIKDRKVNTSIIRLRIGHSSLRQHLYRLRLEISPLCECQQEETVQHIA